MKKYLAGITAAAITIAAAATTASAEYRLETSRNDNTVTAEIIADGAVLTGMEFVVNLPDNIEVSDWQTVSGAFFNEDNGHFAWAGIESPDDGTVMYSVTFTVEDDYAGELTVTPIEGYEDDMPEELAVDINGGDTETEKDNAEDTKPQETNGTAGSSAEDGAADAANNTERDENPPTGITLSVASVIAAGAAAAVSFRRKKHN